MKFKIFFLPIFIFFASFLNAQVFPNTTIQDNGDVNKRINFVYLPDGYQAAELPTFITDVTGINADMFSQVPFSNYANFFNVYAIEVPSAESGVDHPGTANDESAANPQPVLAVDTYFDVTFDLFSIHRLLYPNDQATVNNIANANLPQQDQIYVLANSSFYGGGGGGFACSSTHPSGPEIAIHEIGHSFASLGDEYNASCNERPNLTTEDDPTLVKWANWIGEQGIGVYDIGNSCNRPHQNCKMQFLGVPFCAVCREAIIDQIYSLATPIDAYTPTATTQTFTGTPITFDLDVVYPTPNTLEIEWELNGNVINTDVESILINSASGLISGANTLIAKVTDKTTLSRSYLPNDGYEFSVTWMITNNVLPIELSEFYGFSTKNKTIDLFWETSSESNNDYFSIERSFDGKNFSTIGKIKGQGNITTKQYEFKDRTPNHGNNYYRLKQVDFDGKYIFSEIIQITIYSENEFIGNIYPNPVKQGMMHFDYQILQDEVLEIKLVNQYGETILVDKRNAAAGNGVIDIDVQHLVQGYYFCQIITPSQRTLRSFIKL